MPNLFSIENKIVLISGAGRGIGRHLAHSMAKHSAFVYCIDKKFPKEVPKDVKKNMFNVKCDITNNRSFTKVCQNIFKTHKKIDVLVNNAGVTFP
jgi:NADP-dependent 3-hydroxy acid dehydrogenase YdfG